MVQSRPSILLTGFGPFPGISDNATTMLVPELAAAARDRFREYEIVHDVLPVEWQRAPQLLQQLLMRTNPVLALHFGVTTHASGFQIELTGRNVCAPRSDAAGELPAAAYVIEAGPETLASSFPAERIIARLAHAGLPCATSESAGTYLCNALLYHSLTSGRCLPHPPAIGFVHLPADLSPTGATECGMSWNEALAGGMEIIAACLDAETGA